jgi:hypothetical protein
MKKIVLAFICLTRSISSAQPTTFNEAPQWDGGTTAARAPNGVIGSAYMRNCALVLASELTAISSGNTITAFGFTLNNGTISTPVAGNFTLYLENTTNTVYSKSTTFATAITGMSQAYTGIMTIPQSAGSTSIILTLNVPFVYTGGGIYVAYDWYSPGPYDSGGGAVYRSNYLGLNPGSNTGTSGSAAPATLTGASSHRPCFLWGVPNSYTNEVQYLGMEAPGNVAAMFNTGHVVRSLIKNASNQPLNNIVATLNVGGANIFTNTQTITTLAAGAVATVNFAAFNPQTPGLNTLTVSVPADQNNSNNSGTYNQSVTCNEWSQNPATGNYTNSVGFNTGSGIIASMYVNPVTSTLSALKLAISTNTPNVNNAGWGVLMSSTGVIIATTNTITITSGMLGTTQTFNFATAQPLTPGTTYYLGFAQPANTTLGYYPAASLTWPYVPSALYVTTTLAGGALTPLLQNLGYFGIQAVFTPTITLAVTPATVVCGSPATLNAVSSTNYSWSTSANTSSIVVSPTVTTIYTVTATNTIGCAVSQTVNVNITALPVLATASSGTICLGSPVTLSVSGGATSFTWNNGPSPNAQTFNDLPTQSTIYGVIGSNTAGCTNSSSVIVMVQSFTALTLSTGNASVCLGNTISLTAGGANSYTWFTTTGTFSTPVITTQPPSSTVYSVTGADALGCSVTRTVNVTVHSVTLSVTGNTPICTGQTTSITASGAVQYQWNGNPFNPLSIPVTSNTTAVLSGTDANLCTNSVVISITVNPLPTLSITATMYTMCTKELNTISALGAVNYTWSNSVAVPVFTITPTNPGLQNYTVTGKDANGCVNTTSVAVKVNACTGLRDDEMHGEVSIWPNPSSGEFTVKASNGVISGTVYVYDINGRLVHEKKADGSSVIIDLSGDAPGVYLLKMDGADGGTLTGRLLKN